MSMSKTLFLGGIKSGKSLHAEQYAIECFIKNPVAKPVYLATNEVHDTEMLKKIAAHKKQRKDHFTTHEEPLNLIEAISQYDTEQIILIECMTMWLNNMLYYQYTDEDIFNQIEQMLKLPQQLIFVLNDVGSGIIPENALAREFVDLSGKTAQILGTKCQQVFFCIAGLKQQLK